MPTNSDAITPRRRIRSVSQVDQLLTCGWQYKLKRIDRAPETPSLYLVGGIAAHATADYVDRHIIATSALPSLDDAADHFRGRMSMEMAKGLEIEPDVDKWQRSSRKVDGKPNGEDLDWWMQQASRQFSDAYMRWRNATRLAVAEIDGKPAIELSFDLDFGPPGLSARVKGSIDRIFIVDGQLVCVDLKTSSREPDSLFQLATYRKAFTQKTGLDLQWGGYFMFRTGRLTGLRDLKEWTDDMVDSQFMTADSVIGQGQFLANPGSHCRNCGVKKWCIYQGGTPYNKETN